MAINVSDVFKIEYISLVGGCYWSVTWPDFGKIQKLPNQVKIVSSAAGSTWDRFGIALDDGNVHWIDPIVLLQGNIDIAEVVGLLNLSSPVVGVAFSTENSAEKFVEAMEQKIIMNILTRYD